MYPPHKALSLCPLFSSLPRTTITATPSLYTPHEIVVPGQVRLGPGARIEDQKYIQCVVDTGCIPCHGLFARGLFDRLRPSDQYIRVADPAPNPLRLVGAGDSILGGGDWGVYVTLQVPIIAQDGRWEVAECVDVFLYEADIAGGEHILLGDGFLSQYRLLTISSLGILMQDGEVVTRIVCPDHGQGLNSRMATCSPQNQKGRSQTPSDRRGGQVHAVCQRKVVVTPVLGPLEDPDLRKQGLCSPSSGPQSTGCTVAPLPKLGAGMGDLTTRTDFHSGLTQCSDPEEETGNGQVSTGAGKGNELALPHGPLLRFQEPHSRGVARGMVHPLQLDLPPHPHGNLDVLSPSGPIKPPVLVGNPHLNNCDIQFFLEKEDTPGVVGDPPCQQIERLSQALVVGGNPPFETPQNYQQSALSGAQCAPEMKKIKKEESHSSPRVFHDTVRLVIPPLDRYVARAHVIIGEPLGVARYDQDISSEEDSASEADSVLSGDSKVGFLVSGEESLSSPGLGLLLSDYDVPGEGKIAMFPNLQWLCDLACLRRQGCEALSEMPVEKKINDWYASTPLDKATGKPGARVRGVGPHVDLHALWAKHILSDSVWGTGGMDPTVFWGWGARDSDAQEMLQTSWGEGCVFVAPATTYLGEVVDKIFKNEAQGVIVVPGFTRVFGNSRLGKFLASVEIAHWDYDPSHPPPLSGPSLHLSPDCLSGGKYNRVIFFNAFGSPLRAAFNDHRVVAPRAPCGWGEVIHTLPKGKPTAKMSSSCIARSEVTARAEAEAEAEAAVRAVIEVDGEWGVGDKEIVEEYRNRIRKEYPTVLNAPELGGDPTANLWKRGPCGEAVIKLKEGAVPKKEAPFRLMGEREAALRERLGIFLEKGWIRRSNSPWAARAFVVPKPGGKWRVVIDYRYLNSQTVDDGYPIPVIEDMVTTQSKNGLWSVFDLEDGFHQMMMHPEHRYLTAFVTPWGQFEWLVMPMGIKNGPGMFQRMVDWILSQDLPPDESSEPSSAYVVGVPPPSCDSLSSEVGGGVLSSRLHVYPGLRRLRLPLGALTLSVNLAATLLIPILSLTLVG